MERKSAKRSESADDELDQYRAKLMLDRDDLDAALLEQPDLFFRVGDKLALAISLRDQAKMDLEKEMAEAQKDLRSKYDKKEQKYTEKSILAEVEMDDAVVTLREAYIARAGAVGRWGALKDAFEQRSKALKDLCNLYAASYFTRSSVSSGARDKDEADAEEARSKGGKVRRQSMKE